MPSGRRLSVSRDSAQSRQLEDARIGGRRFDGRCRLPLGRPRRPPALGSRGGTSTTWTALGLPSSEHPESALRNEMRPAACHDVGRTA